MAETIIHEGIHAALKLQLKGQDTGLTNLVIYLQYLKEYNGYTNMADHIFIADLYIKPVASVLWKLDGGKHSNEKYLGLVYEGLQKWVDHGNLDRLSDIYEPYLQYKDLVKKLRCMQVGNLMILFSFFLFACDDSQLNEECGLINLCINYVFDSLSWLPKEDVFISHRLHGISEEDIKIISSIDSIFITMAPVKLGDTMKCSDLDYPIISREMYYSKERKEDLFGCSPIFIKGDKAVVYATFENKNFFVPLLVFFQKNDKGEWVGVSIIEHGIG